VKHVKDLATSCDPVPYHSPNITIGVKAIVTSIPTTLVVQSVDFSALVHAGNVPMAVYEMQAIGSVG